MSPFNLTPTKEQALQILTPSSPSSIDPLSPGQSDLTLVEYFKQATDEVYSQYMPQSNTASSHSVDFSADSSYPSPATSPATSTAAGANCINASEKIKTEDSDLIQVEPDPSQFLRRRGPGRPSKAQLAAQGAEKRLTGRSLITMRRQIHNGSAMRSRARFNAVLDELWNEIPENDRLEASMDTSRQLSRAEKIEHVILYVRSLKPCRKF